MCMFVYMWKNMCVCENVCESNQWYPVSSCYNEKTCCEIMHKINVCVCVCVLMLIAKSILQQKVGQKNLWEKCCPETNKERIIQRGGGKKTEERGERRRRGEKREEEEDYFMICTEQWNWSFQSILFLSECSSHSSVMKSQNTNYNWILQTTAVPVGSWIFCRTWMEDQPGDQRLIRGHVELGCPSGSLYKYIALLLTT